MPNPTRRSFIIASGLTAFSATRILGANDTLRVGVLGAGGRMNDLLNAAEKVGGIQIAAVNDVYAPHADAVKLRASGKDASSYPDYRQLLEQNIDLVIIASPDHWHVRMAVDALNAGKDVYLEKPVTHTIEEGAALTKAVRTNKKILQCGMQQRSWTHFRDAVDLIQGGSLGRVPQVRTYWWQNYNAWKNRKPLDAKLLDWKQWLGGAPEQPFSEDKYYLWRWYWSFGGGAMTDLFTHWIDVVHWAMRVDQPRDVHMLGDKYVFESWECPDTVQALLRYPGFDVVYEGMMSSSIDDGGLEFRGTEATLKINRGGFSLHREAAPSKSNPVVKADSFQDGTIDHMQNFLDCVRSRREPNAPVEAGVAAARAGQIANLAYNRSGQIAWPAKGAACALMEQRRTTMKIANYFSTLWAGPDPVLAGAGIAGELLVAKIRLVLATLLLLIPVINSLFFFPVETKEGLIGLSLASGTFILAAIMYVLISRSFNTLWLGFVSSSFDVTLITAALTTFLLVNQPHTAVNSKVVFEGYFLAIASTSLRYDKRICITAGLLAFAEYFAIVYFTARHWDLNGTVYAPYPYGLFSWSAQISRLIMMLTASALSIALVSRSQRLLQLATSDSLTGLFNRGYVDDRLAMELSRAQRYGKSLTLVVIDADRFKALNDTHGHAAGDLVLKKLAGLLRGSFRLSDTTGRYGGEEFVVILPETDLETARRKVETLRETIASTPIRLPDRDDTVRVTISAGLASFPEDGGEAAELFAIADERMFAAKRAGRDRIVTVSAIDMALVPR